MFVITMPVYTKRSATHQNDSKLLVKQETIKRAYKETPWHAFFQQKKKKYKKYILELGSTLVRNFV